MKWGNTPLGHLKGDHWRNSETSGAIHLRIAIGKAVTENMSRKIIHILHRH